MGAYALLSVLIYAHNSATKVHGRTVISPLSSCQHVQASDFKPIGIVPKVKRTQTLQNSSHWEIDVCETVMDMHVVVEVYTKSVQKHNIMKALENMGLCRLTDYVSSFVPYQLGPFATPASCNVSDKLSDYGLKVAPAPPDGNCFFNAVAINIMADLTNWSECLTAAGIVTHNLTVQTLSGMLRQAFVTELLSERCSTYEAFTDNDLDITAETQKQQQVSAPYRSHFR